MAICIVIFLVNTPLFISTLFCILFHHFLGKIFRVPFIKCSRSGCEYWECLPARSVGGPAGRQAGV